MSSPPTELIFYQRFPLPLTLVSLSTLCSIFNMANAARTSLRRFTSQAVRAASVNYAAPAAEQANPYGIKVSKAQGYVDQLTGGQ